MKLLTSLTTLLLATGLSAQCFESNFGTSLGVGDDSLLALTPMNITFPMGGIATSYTHVHPSTNGFLYLTNGTAASGASSYSTSAATMVTNLRGTAGSFPRIAPYWRDLNLLAANSAGLFVNNTIPGKCVVTWVNAVHFNQTSPVFTFQAQLFASGEVRFFYSGTAQNVVACPIAGISEGNLVADPGVSNLSTASAGVSTSKIVYETFATLNTFDLQNISVAFTPNTGGGYDVTPAACVPATNTNYGLGCNGVSGTFYETFATNGFDLANTSFLMTPNGQGGYTMSSVAPTPLFTHTVAGLALGDDAVADVALPSAFTYPGGSTTTVSVCSNGYVWLQPNTSTDFSPTSAELFANAARICGAWCDLVPDGATNVANVFAEHDVATNRFYFTWLNVPTFAVGGTVTLQIYIDLSNFRICIQVGTATVPAASITAWTPGTGVSVLDLGSRDISATLPAGFSTGATEGAALALGVAPAPILGTTVTWTTSNIPASALFSQLYISTAQQTPALDLTSLGAPECFAHVQFLAFISLPVIGTGSVGIPLPLPADQSLVGSNLFSQTITLNLPSNTLGVITTNGVRSVLNSF